MPSLASTSRARGPSLTPSQYRLITLVALFLLCFIIVTGGAVRLTGSGLGCPQWPNCDEGSLVPRSASDTHAMIEFVNRTVTGLVSLAVMAAVLGSLLRQPRRRDLVWLSWGLVAGVLGQIVLGGITVLVHLHPVAVMSHFLLSMVIVFNAVVLHWRAGLPDHSAFVARSGPSGAAAREKWRWAVLVLAAAVIFTGTIVTASGPHGGDEEVRRLGFRVDQVARVHGATVIVLLLATLAVLYVLRQTPARRAVVVLLGVLLAQGAVGYTQYFTGVPEILVGVHILGAVLVWIATIRLWLAPALPLSVPGGGDSYGAADAGAADPAVAAGVLR
jgi:cytochrome c oxidase assembly protein subunit 15